ncbi:MAG: RodZ domain-containing protein [Candidatus Omnitrophota bacterium]
MAEVLGDVLRNIRESKDLSLEDAAERTRITKDILMKIEENRLSEIASAFYTRNFVRSYSKFLGAENEKAVKDFLETVPKKDDPILEIKARPPVEPRALFVWFTSHKQQLLTGFVTIVGIWILFLGILGIKNIAGKPLIAYREKMAYKRALAKEDKKEVKKEKLVGIKPKEAALAKEVPGEPAKPVLETPAPEPEKPKEEPIKIETDFDFEIFARYNVWLEVVSDDKLQYRGILKKDEKNTWHAERSIKVKVGNAGAVLLKLDNKALGSPGQKGEKMILSVAKDGVKKQ